MNLFILQLLKLEPECMLSLHPVLTYYILLLLHACSKHTRTRITVVTPAARVNNFTIRKQHTKDDVSKIMVFIRMGRMKLGAVAERWG